MSKNEDFFQVIGHISVFFSTLDFMTSVLITKLIISNEKSRFKDNTTLTQKFRIIEDYKEHEVSNIDILNELKEFMPEAIEISKKRNRFIHDQWIFRPENIEIGKIERAMVIGLEGNKTQLETFNHSLEDLYQLLNEIGSIQKKVGALLGRLELAFG